MCDSIYAIVFFLLIKMEACIKFSFSSYNLLKLKKLLKGKIGDEQNGEK